MPKDLHDILHNVDFTFNLKYRGVLIEKGVYNIPITFKQGSVSYAHAEDDIYKTIQLTRGVLQAM